MDAPSIELGSKVRLRDLTTNNVLNEAVGLVVEDPDPATGRWGVKLLCPLHCVAQYPAGVRVLPNQLKVLLDGAEGRLPLAMRQQMAQNIVNDLVDAVAWDEYPPLGIQALFGIQANVLLHNGSLTTRPIGEMMYCTWYHLFDGFLELQYALAAIGAVVLLDIHAMRHLLGNQVIQAMLEGDLPGFFQRQVREMLASPLLVDRPGVGPNNAYLLEMVRRRFGGITWDMHSLMRIAGFV